MATNTFQTQNAPTEDRHNGIMLVNEPSTPTMLRGGCSFTNKVQTTQMLAHPPELLFSTEPFATGAKTRFVLDGVIPVYWYEIPAPRG